MIANLDFIGILIDVARDHFVIGLLSLGDYVERVPDLHTHIFILWRMVNFVFTDELLIALVVFLVQPNCPGGQRHAELVRLRIPELNVHADLLLNRLARIVVVRVVIVLAVQHELLLHIKAGGL